MCRRGHIEALLPGTHRAAIHAILAALDPLLAAEWGLILLR